MFSEDEVRLESPGEHTRAGYWQRDCISLGTNRPVCEWAEEEEGSDNRTCLWRTLEHLRHPETRWELSYPLPLTRLSVRRGCFFVFCFFILFETGSLSQPSLALKSLIAQLDCELPSSCFCGLSLGVAYITTAILDSTRNLQTVGVPWYLWGPVLTSHTAWQIRNQQMYIRWYSIGTWPTVNLKPLLVYLQCWKMYTFLYMKENGTSPQTLSKRQNTEKNERMCE